MALSVQLVDYRLLFISSHFAAHDDKVDRRNADFHRIKAGLFSSSSSSSLADMGATGGSNTNCSGCVTPVLGSTTHHLSDAWPLDGSRQGSMSQGGRLAEGQAQAQVEACSLGGTIRQPGGARSDSPGGWLAGLWDSAGQQSVCLPASSTGTLSPCPSNGSECAMAAPQADDIYRLRAASCPASSAGSHQQHSSTVAGAVRSEAPSPRQGCTPPATLTPRSGGTSVRCGSPAVGSTSQGGEQLGASSPSCGQSTAGEQRNHLSFFKSFMAGKPTAELLGSK